MDIYFSQDTRINPGNYVFDIYGYLAPGAILGVDIGIGMVSITSSIAYDWVGASVNPGSLNIQVKATQNRMVHSQDFANLTDYFTTLNTATRTDLLSYFNSTLFPQQRLLPQHSQQLSASVVPALPQPSKRYPSLQEEKYISLMPIPTATP